MQEHLPVVNAGQVDFERRFNKKPLLQAGAKFSSDQVSNDVRYDTIRNGMPYPDLSRTEKLAY
jgi:hypothetical protein